jgi:hypothetical protein
VVPTPFSRHGCLPSARPTTPQLAPSGLVDDAPAVNARFTARWGHAGSISVTKTRGRNYPTSPVRLALRNTEWCLPSQPAGRRHRAAVQWEDAISAAARRPCRRRSRRPREPGPGNRLVSSKGYIATRRGEQNDNALARLFAEATPAVLQTTEAIRRRGGLATAATRAEKPPGRPRQIVNRTITIKDTLDRRWRCEEQNIGSAKVSSSDPARISTFQRRTSVRPGRGPFLALVSWSWSRVRG